MLGRPPTIPAAAEPDDGRLHPRLPSLARLEYVKALATAVLVVSLLALTTVIMLRDREQALRIVAGRWSMQ